MDPDLQLAIKLDRELNSNPSPVAVSKRKQTRSEKESSIVNPEWEITDPNPDIHMLFQVFDKKYFWGRLDCVEVKWSPRMYSYRCAGICTYKGKWGGCVISLSLPLLKLRPRKDLIETLLHEMIHAYLFVADKNRDRGEHGPKFHEHMFRINREAGTKITVYHTFHDEVKHYKQHWWRCNGPCQGWKPFFGLVKRSMNRAPGPNDFWFADHQAKCGGEFIKIKEPENFKFRKRGSVKETDSTKKKSKGSLTPLTKMYPNLTNKNETASDKKPSNTKISAPTNPVKAKKLNPVKNVSESGIKTLKNNNSSASIESYFKISNVHGFTDLAKPCQKPSNGQQTVPPRGTTGLKSNMGGTLLLNPKPSTSQMSAKKNDIKEDKQKAPTEQTNIVPFSGTGHLLGTSGVSISEARKNFLDRFKKPQPSTSKRKLTDMIDREQLQGTKLFKEQKTNATTYLNKLETIDIPEFDDDLKIDKTEYQNELESIDISDFDDDMEIPDRNTGVVHCPVCNKEMPENAMNKHLDSCATLDSVFESSNCIDNLDDEETVKDSNLDPNKVNCPVCGYTCSVYDINRHLDSCLN